MCVRHKLKHHPQPAGIGFFAETAKIGGKAGMIGIEAGDGYVACAEFGAGVECRSQAAHAGLRNNEDGVDVEDLNASCLEPAFDVASQRAVAGDIDDLGRSRRFHDAQAHGVEAGLSRNVNQRQRIGLDEGEVGK